MVKIPKVYKKNAVKQNVILNVRLGQKGIIMISNFGGKFWNPNPKIRSDFEWGSDKKLPNDGLALKRPTKPAKPVLPNPNEIDKGKIDKGIKDTFDNFG